MASRGTQRMRLATLTGWTSFSSQDLVGPGSHFPVQLQSHNGEKNWNKASNVFCGRRIKRAFQAPARGSSSDVVVTWPMSWHQLQICNLWLSAHLARCGGHGFLMRACRLL
jgi:hypothetical protein